MPDIREDFAANELEFVQVLDRLAVPVDYIQAPQHLKCFRIQEAERGSAIAQDQAFLVVSEPPAFALIVERAQQFEAGAVVDETFAGSPRELNQAAAPIGQAFAEILRGKIIFLENAAAFNIHPA